jgi:hypothetical protein
MKKIIIFLIVVAIILVVLTFIISDSKVLTKMNIAAQLIYTFVTTVLVILTFSTLKLTRDQKHQSVRPYLMIGDFDISPVNCNDDNYDELEFHIYNEGIGLAKNISVKLFAKETNELLYEGNHARLNVESGSVARELDGIQQSIANMKNEKQNIIIPSQMYPSIDIEFKLNGKANDLFSCRIELTYNDIYEKKYISHFNITYNVKEDEIEDFNETFIEL